MEKEIYKPKVGYEIRGDKVFLVIPQGNYSERRLVMTKDIFIACYEHWIKKVGHDRISTEEKTGKWILNVDRWGDTITTVDGYTCSECGAFNTDKDNYCPNCGAKMVD